MTQLPTYENSVFINCPFDPEYLDLFHAMIFTISCLGFSPRCSLEAGYGGIRLIQIIEIIEQCKYGIHDISRVELDNATGLPRFNMPMELGIDLGCRHFGGEQRKTKSVLILDTEKYRYQKYLSDMSGVDGYAHNNDIGDLIKSIRNWLQKVSAREKLPGGPFIQKEYARFIKRKPKLCRQEKLDLHDLTFIDYNHIVRLWIKDRKEHLPETYYE